MTHTYLSPLQQSFTQHANAMEAKKMAKYMRNQFAFLGIKSPLRKELTKAFFQMQGLPDKAHFVECVLQLWALPEREYQYVALDLLARRKKYIEQKDIALLEELVVTKSWWDTVDALASNAVGGYFKRFPEQILPITEVWISSEDKWLQRTAILFQLKYKMDTDTDLLFDYISRCADSEEFFIQKAIGWALREYSKHNEKVVRTFVAQQPLKALSKREALKWLGRKKE